MVNKNLKIKKIKAVNVVGYFMIMCFMSYNFEKYAWYLDRHLIQRKCKSVLNHSKWIFSLYKVSHCL